VYKIPVSLKATPSDIYASAAKNSIHAVTSMIFGFNFLIHFTPKMFAAIRSDVSLYYYTITHWPLTLKTFSATPTRMMNTLRQVSF